MKNLKLYNEFGKQLFAILYKDNKWLLVDRKGNVYAKGSPYQIKKVIHRQISKGNWYIV
jgi:hypothetical protein